MKRICLWIVALSWLSAPLVHSQDVRWRSLEGGRLLQDASDGRRCEPWPGCAIVVDPDEDFPLTPGEPPIGTQDMEVLGPLGSSMLSDDSGGSLREHIIQRDLGFGME